MKSEETLLALNETAFKALNKGDIEELYVIRTHMNALVEEEEKKPLDLHTDAYNACASLVCLDMFKLHKALEYLEKIKEPTEGHIRRIEKTKEDIKTYYEMSDVLSLYINVARNGSVEQLRHYAETTMGLSKLFLPKGYGKTLILIQLLKSEGIIHYRLQEFNAAVISLEKAHQNMPADPEIMYYLIKSLRETGQNQRANYLIEYAKRLYLEAEHRNILINL